MFERTRGVSVNWVFLHLEVVPVDFRMSVVMFPYPDGNVLFFNQRQIVNHHHRRADFTRVTRLDVVRLHTSGWQRYVVRHDRALQYRFESLRVLADDGEEELATGLFQLNYISLEKEKMGI